MEPRGYGSLFIPLTYYTFHPLKSATFHHMRHWFFYCIQTVLLLQITIRVKKILLRFLYQTLNIARATTSHSGFPVREPTAVIMLIIIDWSIFGFLFTILNFLLALERIKNYIIWNNFLFSFCFRARLIRITRSRARTSHWTRRKRACAEKRRDRLSTNWRRRGWG